jgi:hypothetical protein
MEETRTKRMFSQLQNQLKQFQKEQQTDDRTLKRMELEKKLYEKLQKERTQQTQIDIESDMSKSRAKEIKSDSVGTDFKREPIPKFDCFYTRAEPRIPFVPSILNEKVLICKE